MAVHQAPNRAGTEQGRIAVQDKQIAFELVEKPRRLQNGMRGSKGVRLADIVVAGAQMIPYLFRPITDNDIDVLGRDKLQSILDHAFQNALVSEGLKNQGTAVGCDGILAAGKDHLLANRRAQA
jgi:hypothetical protein